MTNHFFWVIIPKTTIVIMISMISIFFSYASAQSCATCSKAPKSLQEYQKVMKKMIKLLPTKKNKADFVQAGTGNIQRVEKGERWTTLTEAVIKILAPYLPQWGDIHADIKLVYKDPSLQRDRKMLTEIDIKIIDRTMEMAQASRHNDPWHQWWKIIPEIEDMIKEFDTLLKELGYVRLATYDDGRYKLATNAELSYTSLAQMIWQLHTLYKELHKKERYRSDLIRIWEEYDKTDHPRVEKSILESENELLNIFAHKSRQLLEWVLKSNDPLTRFDTWIYLTFDANYEKYREYVWQIQDEYECSIWLARNMCKKDRQEVRKNMSYTYKERVVKDTSHAWNTFLTSRSRLKGVFWRGTIEDEKAADQRAKSLLNSYRWQEMPSKDGFRDIVNVEGEYDPTPIWITSAWKWIRNAFKNKSDTAGSTDNSTALKNTSSQIQDGASPDTYIDQKKFTSSEAKLTFIKELGISEAEAERAKNYDRFLGNYQKDKVTEQKIARMQATFRSVLSLQDKLQIENIFNDVNRATHRFPALSKAVYENMKLLWTKNDKDTMYYAMQKTCELQCGNLEGKVCQYYTN